MLRTDVHSEVSARSAARKHRLWPFAKDAPPATPLGRVITVTGLSVILLTLGVIGTAGPASGAGPTLTAHLYQGYTSFYNWSESGTGGDTLVMELQWDYLAAYDETGSPQMRLAESITATTDAKTWTVKIRPDMVWSDGTPITSRDVLFTWSLGANPNQSYNASHWINVVGVVDWQNGGDFTKPIPGITAPDDLTVVFELIEPDAAFLATLLNFRNFILPSAAITAAVPNIHTLDIEGIWALPFWQAPTVGSGPYRWKKTVTGEFLQFAPNPHKNWRTNARRFGTVIVKPIQDFAVSAAQAQSGDLDFAVVALNDLEGLAAAGLQTATALAPAPIQADFNNSPLSRFHEVEVRQAFMYGCDRRGFVNSVLKGKGLATDTYFFPDWIPKEGIVEYHFDIQKAKTLLDQAGFDYSKPVVWLSWNKDARDRQSFIEDCQAKFKTIDVDIEIVNGLDATNARFQAGEWDLNLYSGYPIVDPDSIRTFLACSAIGGSNFTGYCNPAFDDLMVQASKIADQAQRAVLYKQAQDIYLADAPLMVAYRNVTSYAWAGNLTGVVPNGDPAQAFLNIHKWRKTP